MRIEDIKTGDSLQGIEPAAVVSVLPWYQSQRMLFNSFTKRQTAR
jgi:hypothetical protein